MKKYVVIGSLAVGVIAIALIAFFATTSSDSEDDSRTQPDTVTRPGSQTPAPDSTDTSNTISSGKASYIDYSIEAFNTARDSRRVLVFIDEQHTPSMALDELLSSSLSELPSDVVLFRTPLQRHEQLADSLSVTQPGVALIFDSNEAITGVFIMTEEPDMSMFRASLRLDEQTTSSATE